MFQDVKIEYELKLKAMKTSKLLLFSTLLFNLLVCCNKENSDIPKFEFALSAYIYQQGQPVEDVDVDLEGEDNFKTKTDESGYFEFNGIKTGEYIIRMHKTYDSLTFDDNYFIEKEMNINIEEDTNLGVLKLPKPVYLYEPILNLDKSATIY